MTNNNEPIVPAMQETWKERLIQERNELYAKIEILRKTVANFPNNISSNQRQLLRDQLEIMTDLLCILEARISSMYLGY
jgi:hypothetical protein